MQNGKDKPPSYQNYRRLLIFLALSLTLAFTVTINITDSLRPQEYQYGDIARENIRAPRDTHIPKMDLTVKKGEIIVREGERITEEHLKKLAALPGIEKSKMFNLWKFLSLFVLFFILITILYEYADRNIKKFTLSEKDLIFCAALLLFSTAVVKGSIVTATYFVQNHVANLFYLMPIFAFGMMIRIVLFSEAALIFSVIFALGLGIVFENSIQILCYALLGNILAAYFSGRCENRNTILKAGLYTAFIMSFLVVLSDAFFEQPLGNLPVKAAFIILNGIASSFIALGLLPVIEHVFAYTTDIKLLELANLEHPLLEEMMVNAPGTYHHSIIVGNLSKAAAESIGAHPLFTRVAAYYHDIGKLKMPHYFIENRKGGKDVHQSLSPNMSALIILSHVKEGVELAQQHRLGRKLADMIRQHHGTSLVAYFYNRAKGMEDPRLHVVEERDFRYGGPKPQTKEAGILMLADAVEAASRTLDDPTPRRIEVLVQNVVENIFLDGQLDDCELTLKDLHAIQKSMINLLIGIFHHRIEYPERTINDGTDKKFPKHLEGGPKGNTKQDRKLTRIFRVAG
jgi:cyclic-di-AMP phosphodiesterase PgpH